MMRRERSFRADDTVIWVSSTLLSVVLGSGAAYTASIAIAGATGAGGAFKEVLALIAAGIALIVLALHGRLVKFFLFSLAAVFFIALAIATHGFTTL
ncbi:MAG: hypothetical protein GIW97_05855 [Candidatus Eremiobacteraeota bacterium]|nr:hypothetical protein [Candidatus Eremiobacteraeota bacterium]